MLKQKLILTLISLLLAGSSGAILYQQSVIKNKQEVIKNKQEVINSKNLKIKALKKLQNKYKKQISDINSRIKNLNMKMVKQAKEFNEKINDLKQDAYYDSEAQRKFLLDLVEADEKYAKEQVEILKKAQQDLEKLNNPDYIYDQVYRKYFLPLEEE